MSEPSQDDPDRAGEEGEAIRTDPPPGSPITMERFPDGLTIQIPPAGLWRGSQGLFVIALLWNGIIAVISFVLLGILLGGADKNADKVVWVFPLFLSIFWAVGIGLLLGALNMGRRKAAIAVTGGTLMVIQTGLFGSKQRDWPPGDVEAVRAGPSGMTVNDKAVLELQIVDGGAQRFGLLAGRTDAELAWLASELRSVLRVPEYAT